MKILVTSDWHPDWTTAGVERFDDVEHAVEEALEMCVEQRVDAFVFAGDLCNPGTHRAPRSMALAVRTAERLQDEGIDQLWIPGNHDVIEDGHGLDTLAVLSELGYANVVRSPRLTSVGPRRGGNDKSMSVFCLPFTPRSHDYDPEEELNKLKKEAYASAKGRSGPDMIVGHLNIEGITVGSETSDMPRGRNVFFPYELTRKLFPDTLLVNGHYHQQQIWKGRNGRNKQGIHIPGSLVRLTRTEKDHAPGWLFIETEEG